MFRGSMVAMITPMKADGAVDHEALSGLVEFHIEQGTDAIVAVGTTGESATLTFDEHIDVVESVVRAANGRVSVIAGTGANSTQEAIELTGAARDVKADACLLVTPYYNKPTQQGLYLHYSAIAGAVDIPQIIYNVPGRTACDISDEITIQLSAIRNIIGIKDATGDIQRASNVIAATPDDFLVLSGDDATGMELMLLGGQGIISVTANVAPAKMREMCHYAINGDRENATPVNDVLTGLHEELFVEANPIPVKWAMSEMGYCGHGIRLPLTLLSEEFRPQVKAAMQQAGVIGP